GRGVSSPRGQFALLETCALAPHFTLLGIDGKEYSLPNNAGEKPTLLVFFKTTCGMCDTAFPYINRLAQTNTEGRQLWAIAQDGAERNNTLAKVEILALSA